MSKRAGRTTAEWTTFAVSVAVLLVVMAAIVSEALRHHEDAQPVAVIGKTQRVGEQYQVEVTVENRGDKAASAVQVVASLEIDGDTADADQVVDFLAGGDAEELIFVFADDPDDGELTVEVAGFTVP
ncbi:MAG TPA: CARDB domain-containing protein [Acidimicrobiales bacterium]|nr:CARDB domain-containing protein [Acidimicrobiales bacterium]